MTSPSSPAQRDAKIRNWSRFRLRGVVQTLRTHGFNAEADAVQFHRDEEARTWGRHHKQSEEGTK